MARTYTVTVAAPGEEPEIAITVEAASPQDAILALAAHRDPDRLRAAIERVERARSPRFGTR